jgi:hypothetical protein
MARARKRVGMARALAVLVACFVGTAAAPAAAAAGTVYYSTADVYFSGKLWSVGDHGGNRQLLRQKLFTGPSGVIATLSRDGKRILCLCRRGEVDSIKLDGSDMRRIGSRPRGTRYDVVALGAAGETLWLDERHNRVMMQNADGSHARPVAIPARGRIVEEELAVNRAGDEVAFVSGRCAAGGCETEVWIAPVGGGPKKRVYRTADLRGVYGLQWSQDGRSLAFVDFPEFEDKYETPADPYDHLLVYSGGTVREVPVDSPATPNAPFFAPDGSTLAVAGSAPGTLFAVGPDGQVRRRLTHQHCNEVRCLFGPAVFGWTGG